MRLEGYAPPYDPRLDVIKVTPDPGVIEVNVHPATSWDELVEITTTVYEEARASRGWRTEKFMLDGRHTGTGGGNHIVLGGATPADSPFLRRPDLLAQPDRLLAEPPVAVLPVLAACSSGRPARRRASTRRGTTSSTSWRSRCAEIAASRAAAIAPWLVDRLFRNLLVDVTGNTHRAEFCIDKLYAPERPDGPARPGRAARLRDAAARAHEPRRSSC